MKNVSWKKISFILLFICFNNCFTLTIPKCIAERRASEVYCSIGNNYLNELCTSSEAYCSKHNNYLNPSCESSEAYCSKHNNYLKESCR